MLAKYTIAGLAGFRAAGQRRVRANADRDHRQRQDGAARPRPTTSSSFQGDWRASKLVGLSVYNDKNESVGSINDLLTDKSGNIKAVVIGVGGFLGVGEHLVAVPFDKVKFVERAGCLYRRGRRARERPRRPAVDHDHGCGDDSSRRAATASKPNPWYPDHAVFNATKDELKAMPEFKYSTN